MEDALKNEALKEKLKELPSPEERRAYMRELLGPAFDLLIQEDIATPPADLNDKIKSLRRKGMTTGGIRAYLKENEGVNISREKIIAVPEEDMSKMTEWQNRSLSKIYPIVFLDGMHCSVKENGKTVTKCCYHALGINTDGEKELLGIWIH